MTSGQAVAETFMADLAAGRVDSAYNSTTQGFRDRQTLQQLRDLVNQNPQLKSFIRHSNSLAPGNISPTLITFHGTINSPTGVVSFTLHVVKEGEQWKVDRFTIP